MSSEQKTVSVTDIRAAALRLAGFAVRTPLIENAHINALAGRRVLIKPECLQRTGSFKFRGAWSALTALNNEQRKAGVLAYSSGNHAQGVAHAAQLLDVPATIIMPNDAPALKLANTRGYGADVVLYDRPGGESRESLGESLAAEKNLTLIRPYDHADVIAGQGTCGLEILQQTAEADVSEADVLVCCGGGGLTAGIALALEENSGLRVRPVEPETSDDVRRSLQSGRREFNEGVPQSICDAIVTPSPGELTFPILKRLCGPGLTVTDQQAMQAIAIALIRLKLVAEPGGAVALAAALFHKDAIDSDSVVCVISGGNIDATLLQKCLALDT